MKIGSLSKLNVSNPTVDRVKETISSTHLNGGIIVECFQINNPELLNYPNMNEEYERYFTKILTSSDVRMSIPELNIGKELDCDTDFKWSSSFTLDGDIASVIYNGGAYEGFFGTPREAKRLAQEFCDFIFGDRFLDIQVYKTNNPWCSWFFDIAWDDTYFILDTTLEKIWLICITDTD